MCIAFHPKLPSVIAGGTFNGTCVIHFTGFAGLQRKYHGHLTLTILPPWGFKWVTTVRET